MKNKRKIIYIVNDVWKDSDKMWGFNMFSNKDYDVEVWKIGALLQDWKVWVKVPFKITQYRLSSWKNFYELILHQNMKKTYFFYASNAPELVKSKILIKILGGRYYYFYSVIYIKASWLHGGACLNKKKWELLDLFPPTRNFLATDLCNVKLNSQHEIKHGKNVYIHSTNYDYYLLEQRRIGKNNNKDYILFLDQNLLSHKDIKNFNTGAWVTGKDTYISQLQLFLNRMEHIFGKEIIIAAHPTSDMDEMKRIYDGREIIIGNTCGYVKNCDLVMAYCSSSIDFAILYNKPILFWYADGLKRYQMYKEDFLPKLRILNAKAVNISSLEGEDIEHCITDTSRYDDYKKYIISDDGEKLFWEKVIDVLEE